MSGMDDNVAIIGEWVPPSPSPKSFFSALLGDENGLKSIPEPLAQKETEGFLLGLKDKSMVVNPDGKCSTSSDHFVEPGPSSKLRSGSRGDLMERMAARAGFNAPKLNTEGIRPNDVLNPEARSTLVMLSPGVSPTNLLESPIFVTNSLLQPSPTTGKVPFVPNGSNRTSVLVSDGPDRSKENSRLEDNDSSPFALKPVAEVTPSFFSSEPKVALTFPQQSFPRMEVSAQSDTSPQSRNVEHPKFHPQADFGRSMMKKDVGSNTNNNNNAVPPDQRMLVNSVAGADHSSLLDELQDDEGDQKGNGDSTIGCGGASSEDGYNWRKYGQKQVKGSEYPRSYYKCTHLNCQVKKKVERSHEGHITEIIYKGVHDHPKPPPNRRGVIGGPDMPEQVRVQGGTDVDQGWGNNLHKTYAPDWRQDNFEAASSPSEGPEFCNPSNTSQLAQNGAQFETGDAVDVSSAFSNEECEGEQANGSVSLGYDAEEDESESKRSGMISRRIEAYPADMTGATRAIREPRVVVQTTSEVDILDDGYRWRKYGQKVVKGNPNPRSYYKCTSPGCTVRKHVERASHDLKSVITTYEGKHNHDVPAARNSSHGNPGAGSSQPVSSGIQNHVHLPEPATQAHNGVQRFDGHGAVSSFGLPGRPQLPPHAFSFGLNALPGMTNLPMAGLSAAHGKMPMLPIHPLLAAQQQQQRQVNEMGFMLPKGEHKPEPISDRGLNLSSNFSMYQQFMSRQPLGPQM